ncbi:MAG: hypothetical protein Q8M54_01350 [Desulfobaccales bacterium]|nr:hypothetical protein [Desulfobaccales bacterium]
MKDGLIVYLVGATELPEGFDVVQATQALGHEAHRVELVSQQQGFFTVEDAWHFLLTRGCGRISLMVAQAEDQQRLRPLGPQVRLYG